MHLRKLLIKYFFYISKIGRGGGHSQVDASETGLDFCDFCPLVSPPLYILARQLHVNNRNYFFSLFFFRPLHSIMHYTSLPRIYIYLFIREKEI